MASIFGRGRPKRDLTPPDLPGRYGFRCKGDGGLAYIGQTDRLLTRLRAHLRSGRFPEHTFEYQVAKEGATKAELCMSEVERIKKHRPALNRNRGGGGRR